jgi:hypothetical protein
MELRPIIKCSLLHPINVTLKRSSNREQAKEPSLKDLKKSFIDLVEVINRDPFFVLLSLGIITSSLIMFLVRTGTSTGFSSDTTTSLSFFAAGGLGLSTADPSSPDDVSSVDDESELETSSEQ